MKAHGHSAVFMLTTMCQLESAGNVFSVTTSCDECNIAQVTGSYILWWINVACSRFVMLWYEWLTIDRSYEWLIPGCLLDSTLKVDCQLISLFNLWGVYMRKCITKQHQDFIIHNWESFPEWQVHLCMARNWAFSLAWFPVLLCLWQEMRVIPSACSTTLLLCVGSASAKAIHCLLWHMQGTEIIFLLQTQILKPGNLPQSVPLIASSYNVHWKKIILAYV